MYVCVCCVCLCVVCMRECVCVYQFHFTFSHPPFDKITNDIKVPLYPARDVPYELLIKAFVGQKTRYIRMCIWYFEVCFNIYCTVLIAINIRRLH